MNEEDFVSSSHIYIYIVISFISTYAISEPSIYD